MILAIVGTLPYSFERLVRAVDEIAGTGFDAFIQTGNTPYAPRHCRWQSFLPRDQMLERIRDASLVISHGGFGSLADCLAHEKTVISVARRPELGETFAPQEPLVRALAAQGRIIAVSDVSTLAAAVVSASQFRPASGAENRIPQLISEFLRRSAI